MIKDAYKGRTKEFMEAIHLDTKEESHHQNEMATDVESQSSQRSTVNGAAGPYIDIYGRAVTQEEKLINMNSGIIRLE